MSLVFYYAPRSSAVTCHWALEELGIPYQKVKVDLAAKEQLRPEFVALNPNAKVPLLVHEGTPIFESVAILIHLGETYGVARKLFPAPGPARSQALQWLVWTNVSLGGALRLYLAATSAFVPAEQHNAAAGAAARAEVERLLGVLDASLAGKSWMVGDAFSLVDIHVAGWVDWVGMNGFDTSSLRHLTAWHRRAAKRPKRDVAMAA